MPSPIQIADNEGFDAQAVLSGLARAKVAFQLRAISAVIGIPIETPCPTGEPAGEASNLLGLAGLSFNDDGAVQHSARLTEAR